MNNLKICFLPITIVLALTLSSNVFGQWIHSNGIPSSVVGSFATQGSKLFAGTINGVFLSNDSGATWAPVNFGLTDTVISELAAGSSDLFVGCQDGIFCSTDSGESWRPINNGLPTIPAELQFSSAHALAVTGTNLFAALGGGSFRSTNNGTSWTSLDTVLNGGASSFQVSGSNIFALGPAGIYISKDNGTSWQAINTHVNDQTSSGFAVRDSTIYAFLADTLYRSTDNGTTWNGSWIPFNNNAVFALAKSDSNLFAGLYIGGVFLSPDNGLSWTAVNSGLTNLRVVSLVVFGQNVFVGNGEGYSIWHRPLSEMINPAEAAGDTQIVTFNGAGPTNLTLFGDSARYSAHRINFKNNTNASIVIKSAELTRANNQFSISQTLHSLPYTLSPGETFSIIVHFSGNTSGTLYFDTVYVTTNQPLTSVSVSLKGVSFSSSASGVPQNSQISPQKIQSYPNPLTQSTKISFTSAESGAAEVTIVNLLGSEVARLFSGEIAAGEHSFEWDASGAASGTYWCEVRMNGRVVRSAMVVAE